MTGRDYLRVLWKRWPTIIAGLAVCIVAAAAVGLLTPVRYAAQTQVFVSTRMDAGDVNQQLFQGGSFASDRVQSYPELATSLRVTVPASQDTGSTVTPSELASLITVDNPSGTVLINVGVTDSSAEQAAAMTNAVAGRLVQAIQELETPPNVSQPPVVAAVVVPAGPPRQPVLPNWPLTIALGLLAGLLVGVGGALVRESLDSSVKTEDDLVRVTGVPNLGKVVYHEPARESPVNQHDIRSESFRQLRTNLQFSAVGSPTRTVVITSAVPAEGKSSVTGNLALSMSELGLRVTVIDADLRRPTVSTYLQASTDVGLTTVLIGRTDLDAALQTVRRNLSVLSSGPVPPNPSELLSSGSMGRVLDSLASQSDIVLIDSAPVLAVTDARILAARVDGVLLVAAAGETKRHQVKEAVESLRAVRARVVGTVLNRLPADEVDGSYYGYGTPNVSHRARGTGEPATTA